jgi:hypothetical protein
MQPIVREQAASQGDTAAALHYGACNLRRRHCCSSALRSMHAASEGDTAAATEHAASEGDTAAALHYGACMQPQRETLLQLRSMQPQRETRLQLRSMQPQRETLLQLRSMQPQRETRLQLCITEHACSLRGKHCCSSLLGSMHAASEEDTAAAVRYEACSLRELPTWTRRQRLIRARFCVRLE